MFVIYYLRQCFSTFFKSRNLSKIVECLTEPSLDTQNNANLRILREPSQELAEHLGSAEPRLKNTDQRICSLKISDVFSTHRQLKIQVSVAIGLRS